MEPVLTKEHDGEPNPVDTAGLCLLSLDGGGIRGLSTLYIMKGLMARLNDERQKSNVPRVKPWEVFDLIGGTSTGGFVQHALAGLANINRLIAIMLGRLKMDVDECISAYSGLMKTVFEEKSSWLPISWTGRTKAQFDSKRLRNAIEEVITRHNPSETNLFNDRDIRGCRV